MVIFEVVDKNDYIFYKLTFDEYNELGLFSEYDIKKFDLQHIVTFTSKIKKKHYGSKLSRRFKERLKLMEVMCKI